MVVSAVPMWASAVGGVESKLNAIKAVYPTGSYFTVDGNVYAFDKGVGCQLSQIPARGDLSSGAEAESVMGESWSCCGFARYVFYNIFGTNSMYPVSLNDAQIGDYVVFSGHYGIYLSHDADYVYVYDSNFTSSPTNIVNCNSRVSMGRFTAVYRASNYDEINSTGDLIQNGDIIKFGSYPQTEEKDEATINALNSLAPAWDKWTSYGYYSGDGNIGSMKQGDWMRYVDVPYGDSIYRGVKFTNYRPLHTWKVKNKSNTEQTVNGYETNTVYWFKFEPIKWKVLNAETKLVLSEIVLDSQPFNNEIYGNGNISSTHYSDAEKTIKANKYEQSSIRTWLNINFYEAAFDDNEKIKMMTYGNAPDRVILLSSEEVINSNLGFDSNSSAYDPARFAKGSDYAKCQGLCYVHPSGSFNDGNVHWLLRSSGNTSNSCRYVDINGCSKPNNNYFVSITSDGIRPAIVLKNLDVNAPCKHTNSVNQPQINPNCIDIGYTAGVYCNDCATWLSGHDVIAVGDHKDNTGDGKCDTCLKQLSTPSEPEQPKKNIVQKVVDAVKNAFNNFINFFKKLFGR